MTLPADTHPAIIRKLKQLQDKAGDNVKDLEEEIDLLKKTLAIGTDYHGVCNRIHSIMRIATCLWHIAGAIAILRYLPYDIKEWKE